MKNEISEAVKNFFFPNDLVHQHWFSPLDNFEYSSNDFYQAIEKELQARKVPGLQTSRIDLSEGGLLSDKREYLRLKRERLVFDICAAPFGTSYFFSFRFVELRLGIKPLELVVFFIGATLVLGLLAKVFGTVWGLIAFFAIVGGGIYILRNALVFGLKDLDADLLKIPVIGPLYEVFLRKETYYRQDTRLIYLSTVNTITQMLVEEVTTAKGIKMVKRYDRKPIHGELYQEKIISSEKTAESPLKVVA